MLTRKGIAILTVQIIVVLVTFPILSETALAENVVKLHNKTWKNGVTVEVRVGNDVTDVEANTYYGKQRIPLDGVWEIVSQGEDVFYRRQVNPDDAESERFQKHWSRRAVVFDHDYDVDIE